MNTPGITQEQLTAMRTAEEIKCVVENRFDIQDDGMYPCEITCSKRTYDGSFEGNVQYSFLVESNIPDTEHTYTYLALFDFAHYTDSTIGSIARYVLKVGDVLSVNFTPDNSNNYVREAGLVTDTVTLSVRRVVRNKHHAFDFTIKEQTYSPDFYARLCRKCA